MLVDKTGYSLLSCTESSIVHFLSVQVMSLWNYLELSHLPVHWYTPYHALPCVTFWEMLWVPLAGQDSGCRVLENTFLLVLFFQCWTKETVMNQQRNKRCYKWLQLVLAQCFVSKFEASDSRCCLLIYNPILCLPVDHFLETSSRPIYLRPLRLHAHYSENISFYLSRPVF